MSQHLILMLFLVTVFAGLAGAVWELMGVKKDMRESGDPDGEKATRLAIDRAPDGSAVVRKDRPAWLNSIGIGARVQADQ